MITDYIKNASLYLPISRNLALGFKFIQENDLASLEPGKYEIDGDNVFAIVQQYSTKKLEEASWEAHQKYIDIQHVISGMEQMGFAPLATVQESKVYDADNDYALFTGKGLFLEANPQNFFVFYPQDAHMPGIETGAKGEVKKVVVKVKL